MPQLADTMKVSGTWKQRLSVGSAPPATRRDHGAPMPVRAPGRRPRSTFCGFPLADSPPRSPLFPTSIAVATPIRTRRDRRSDGPDRGGGWRGGVTQGPAETGPGAWQSPILANPKPADAGDDQPASIP
jgi:hypothetical protein